MQAFLNLRFLTPYQVLATLGVHLGEGRERETAGGGGRAWQPGGRPGTPGLEGEKGREDGRQRSRARKIGQGQQL